MAPSLERRICALEQRPPQGWPAGQAPVVLYAIGQPLPAPPVGAHPAVVYIPDNSRDTAAGSAP